MALFFSFKFVVMQLLLINVLISLVNGKHHNPIDDDQNGDDGSVGSIPLDKWDINLIENALNLEYLEAEFFLYGSTGCGLDKHAPELAEGGPSPIGAKKAWLDPMTNDIIYQFALQEIGHLRAIKRTVKGFPRPLLNLSCTDFAEVINAAFGHELNPPFDPYRCPVNFLLASYMIPYVGLTGYVGANTWLSSQDARRLVAGLLASESGQDAVIRTMLYQRRYEKVMPYSITVMDFTYKISELRNKLGNTYKKDEGLVVEQSRGPEGKTPCNILAGNKYSIGFGRTPKEMLRIVYSTGDEKIPGGFFPEGAKGHIAENYLKHKNH